MIMPGESLSTRRVAFVTASFSTINLIWTYRGLNVGLSGKRLVTNPYDPWHSPEHSHSSKLYIKHYLLPYREHSGFAL